MNSITRLVVFDAEPLRLISTSPPRTTRNAQPPRVPTFASAEPSQYSSSTRCPRRAPVTQCHVLTARRYQQSQLSSGLSHLALRMRRAHGGTITAPMRALTAAVLCALLAVGCAPATEPAKLAVNRDHLDFGAIEAGFTSRLAIALSNPGDTTLHVTELALDPTTPELSLEGLPVDALAPGDRKVVVVVFTRSAAARVPSAMGV